jgi:hypothetical protein
MRLQNLRVQNWAAISAARKAAAGALGASSGGGVFATVLSWIGSLSGGAKNALAGALSAGAPNRIDELRRLLPTPTDGMLSNFESFDPSAAAASAGKDASITAPSAVLLSPLASSSPTLLSFPQKLLYFSSSIALRYVWHCVVHRMTMEGWGGAEEASWQKRMYKLMRRMEQMYQLANILNFIVFLRQGCYRSLIERALSIRLLYRDPRLGRSLSFEFMNQQIAWSALSDFMLFLLPLINFGVLQDAVKWMRAAVGLAPPVPVIGAGCPVCGDTPRQPYRAQPCGHVYCYYCLAGNRLAEAQELQRGAQSLQASNRYSCPACDQRVTEHVPA